MMKVTPPAAKRKRRWKKWALAFAAFYALVLLMVGCGHLVDSLVLHPPAGAMDAKGAAREILPLADGGELELWVARSPGAQSAEPSAFVLYFVGNADRAERWATFNAAQWGHKPVEVIGMNYPGFGGSSGPAYLEKIGPAALATFDRVRARAGKRPIFLQSNSVGTTAALCVLARREVAGATIQNPPPLKQLIRGHHGWWNLWLLAGPSSLMVPRDLDSLENARNAKTPAVFILSAMDEVVPVRFQRRIFEAYAGEKRLIDLPAATHNTGMDQAAWDAFGRQVEWLWETAGLGRDNRMN